MVVAAAQAQKPKVTVLKAVDEQTLKVTAGPPISSCTCMASWHGTLHAIAGMLHAIASLMLHIQHAFATQCMGRSTIHPNAILVLQWCICPALRIIPKPRPCPEGGGPRPIGHWAGPPPLQCSAPLR